MIHLKIFEDWRSSGGLHYIKDTSTPEFKERNDVEHQQKFLLDFNYTYNWVLKYHPNLEIDYLPDEDDYEEVAKYEIESRIEEYMELFRSVKGGKIKIQRRVIVSDLSEINRENVGLYWSFKKSDVLFGNKEYPNYEVIFYGETDWSNVNWENSLDNFVYYGHDENEVKLLPNSPIILNKVRVLYRPNWNKIEDKGSLPIWNGKA